MIICGFPGTGKSMMAKFSQWVDLESTPFKKNWLLYAEVAKHMSDNGYTVMVSTHKEMLNALEQIEANYVVVIPPITDKATYLKRYDMRGNTYDFIQLLDENWEKWINAIVEKPTVLKTVVVLPKDGCIKVFADKFGKENHFCGFAERREQDEIKTPRNGVKRDCDNCRYFKVRITDGPCFACDENQSEWKKKDE